MGLKGSLKLKEDINQKVLLVVEELTLGMDLKLSKLFAFWTESLVTFLPQQSSPVFVWKELLLLYDDYSRYYRFSMKPLEQSILSNNLMKIKENLHPL
mmetsp:Transcript_27231/g.26046  ORF Transcript_27231/g.26046 Transcript_27231/m.26046 type:complete len:98 (-) Transcript_27231:634-927(-)